VTSWALAALHLFALAIGLESVWVRGRALRGTLDAAGFRRAFLANAWWGVAMLLWVGTGLLRAFASFEKGSAYYLSNGLFWAKLALVSLIVALEVRPMTALIHWRGLLRSGQSPDTTAAGRYARASAIQAVLVMLIIVIATGMARGYGMRPR
jgi:putative membrane protein